MRPERQPGQTEISRRKALARLGLGAAVAYAAPTIVHLDRSANAAFSLTPCEPPGGGRDRCKRDDKPKRDDRRGH